MAYRCPLGNHNRCVACKSDILPSSEGHIHHYHRSRNTVEQLCGSCATTTFVAAAWVLETLQHNHINIEDWWDLKHFLNERCLIGVQDTLPLDQDPAN